MEPLQASHADRVTPVSGAPGFEVKRVLSGYAYPIHGNVHNPTPRYSWLLLLNGRVVDSDAKRGPLVDAARRPGALAAYSETGAGTAPCPGA
jgi:hypothetical protein